jgi:hypothetical protein
MFKKHGITVKFVPAKSVFLFSPLDRKFFGEFTIKFDNVIKQRPENEKFRKYNATLKVYFDIPNKHVVSFFEKCGLIGGAFIDGFRQNFTNEVNGFKKVKDNILIENFESWLRGDLLIDGTKFHRNYTLERLQQLEDEILDSDYWTRWGRTINDVM